MSQRCKTCSGGYRLEIDRDLIANLPYPTISAKYGVPVSSLKYHIKNHLNGQIAAAKQKAEKIIEREIIATARKYREEVYLPPTEKAYFVQHQLIQLGEQAEEANVRLGAWREVRGWTDMDHKIAGSYQEKRVNETDAAYQLFKQSVERVAAQHNASVPEVVQAMLELKTDWNPVIRERALKELGSIG